MTGARLLLPFLLAVVALPASAEPVPPGREAARRDPAVRVHWPAGVHWPDRDDDGVPEPAAVALDLAARVARECRALGLGSLPDDGDGEADLWLLPGPPPAGAIALPTREARRDPLEFRAETARRIAGAVLDARAPGAPRWWREPTACWIAREVAGLLPRSCAAPDLRWNHPEPGVAVTDPLLRAANLALLDGLGREPAIRAALRATWRRLRGDPAGGPVATVDEGLREATGLGLAGVLLRSGVARVAAGPPPARWAAEVRALPVLGEPLGFPIHPLGGALVRVRPDPRFPAATALELAPDRDGFRLAVLARRPGGTFDRVDPSPGPDGVFRLSLPWRDYDEAILVLARDDSEPGPAEVELRAEPGPENPPFDLASFSATPAGGGTVLLAWRTSREDDVAAWRIERSVSGGPWTAVTPVPLPPLGSLTGGGAYLVPDRAPAGEAARWRLVALLGNGLRWTGPTVTLHP